MMGQKDRDFHPLPKVSLEDLVPADHFYRDLDRSLDLSFVRDLVRYRYSPVGRPSIDPVVFSRPQLVLFFEGLHSGRRLMEQDHPATLAAIPHHSQPSRRDSVTVVDRGVITRVSAPWLRCSSELALGDYPERSSRIIGHPAAGAG